MHVPSSLLKRHVLESNRIEGIHFRSGALFTSHLRAAALVARHPPWQQPVHPLAIHRTLSRFTPMEWFGGEYRTCRIWVGDTEMPSWERVPALMEWWWGCVGEMSQVSSEKRPDAALLLHDFLLHIHPFRDGNGRTARLFLNSVRLKHGLSWRIISLKERSRYYAHIRATERIFRSATRT